MRYALGASRGALARLYFVQTLIVAVAGGIAAIGFERLCAVLLLHLARLDRSGAVASSLDGYALGVHWFAAIAAGLLIGVFPAWHAARIDLAAALAEGAGTHSASRSQARTRRALAAIQIALSLALLIVAGLFAKSLRKLTSPPVGFDPDHLTVFSVDPKLAGSNVETARNLYSNIEGALERTPGVQSAAYGTGGPFPQGLDFSVLIPNAKTAGPKHAGGSASVIGPHYFATLGIPVVEGREFDSRDRVGTPRGVIINQALARQLFPHQNAVGQPVTVFNGLDPNWQGTIIGVVAEYRLSWKHGAGKQIYTCAQQAPRAVPITFYVRTTAGSALKERSLRELVAREAPMLSAFDIQPMQVRMEEFASGDRAMTLLIGAFAAIALAISLIGIYGVVAYTSSLRVTEFGVRLALGAQPVNVLWLVLREAVLIVAAGLVLAIPVAWFALSLARTQLHEVSLHDPTIYTAAIAIIAVCVLVTAGLPASRAARMNVHAALRRN